MLAGVQAKIEQSSRAEQSSPLARIIERGSGGLALHANPLWDGDLGKGADSDRNEQGRSRGL